MKQTRHSFSAPTAQRGFSIIEVLVAAVILSIGMLGLAGLQMRTLRNNQSSLERGVAVLKTHAIADALRGDRISAGKEEFDVALGAADPAAGTFAATIIARWRANIRAELGAAAKGAVDCDGMSCEITIQWDDSRGSGSTATQQLVTVVQI